MAFDMLLLNVLLQIATIILTPLLIAYALLAYRGQYESRSLPSIIAVALLLGFSTVFGVWSNLSAGSKSLALLQNACVLFAMLVLFILLRSYIHSEIDLRRDGKLKPRHVLQKKTV